MSKVKVNVLLFGPDQTYNKVEDQLFKTECGCACVVTHDVFGSGHFDHRKHY